MIAENKIFGNVTFCIGLHAVAPSEFEAAILISARCNPANKVKVARLGSFRHRQFPVGTDR